MPQRSALTAAQLAAVFAPPVTAPEIARHYTLDERDLALIRQRRGALTALALQTNNAVKIADALLDILRTDRIIVPSARVIDRLCTEALARGTRLFYHRLTDGLDGNQHRQLDRLLPHDDVRTLLLTWLRQPPGEAPTRHLLTHLDRLEAMRAVGLPPDLERAVHQSRLVQLAREGAQMSAQHLRDRAGMPRSSPCCSTPRPPSSTRFSICATG